MAADITTGLFASYTCNDAADGQVDDAGPNGLHLPVTANTGYPLRTIIAGAPVREFTRQFTSGASAVATNFAKLTGISQATYQLFAGGAATFAFWVYVIPDTLGWSSGAERFLAVGGDAAGANSVDNRPFGFINHNRTGGGAGTISFNWGFGVTSQVGKLSTYLLPESTWTHITYVFEAGGGATARALLYVNGVFQEASTYSTQPASWLTPPATGGIGLGVSNIVGSTASQCGARMRAVRLYSRALTAQDIGALVVADNIDPTSFTVPPTFGSPTMSVEPHVTAIAQTVSFGRPRVGTKDGLYAATVSVDVNDEVANSAATVDAAVSNSSAPVG